MFGRKKRLVSSPPVNNGAKPSSSAATAAAQAFLKNQASSASLAAAAAGAALRSRPTTPTSVADVQTKRMLRRTASNTSQGSSGGGSLRGPPGSQLERRGSGGSMSERTFRDPSPNRDSARPSIDDDAPPVPAIPKHLASGHRRTSSMESPVTRVASPPPNTASGRGSSLGPPPSGSQPMRRQVPRISSLSSVSELTGTERPASRGSVNFSYPTSNRAMSPYGQRQLTYRQSPNQVFQKPNLVYDPNTRSFRPQAELLFLEQSIQDMANRPPRRKKKLVSTQPLVGSHLADGTAGGRIKGTALESMQPTASELQPQREEEPGPEPVQVQAIAPPRRKKKKVAIQSSSEADSCASTGTSDAESDSSERPKKYNTRAGALLRKPSTVQEDREQEEAQDEASKFPERQAALRKLESPEARTVSPPPRVGLGHGRAPASAGFAQSRQQTRSASLPAHGLAGPVATTPVPVAKGQTTENPRPARVQSVSPMRTAHFMHSPESLAVRHDPPPRAISPRKSALKQSSSPRGGSPAPESMGRGHVATLSEVSDTSTAISDAGLPLKKKSVRVSFDDERTMVVGEAAGPLTVDSPLAQSPQTKRNWFNNISRGKKKDPLDMDDDDEIMKPRPALPSFGSIREKKNRDIEDRPLVKPSEPLQVNPSPPLSVSPANEVEPIGHSHDDVAGALFAQDQASKNAANISKSREPLPPQVTSVEGSGYVSDSSSSTYSLNADLSAMERANSVKRGPMDGNAETYRALASPEPEHAKDEEPAIPVEKMNGNGSAPGHPVAELPATAVQAVELPVAPVPAIETPTLESPVFETKPTTVRDMPTVAVTQASPIVQNTATTVSWPHVPGGFPDASSDSGKESSEVSLVETIRFTDLTPAAFGITEPDPAHHEAGEPIVGGIAALNLHHIQEETQESDRSSIYSDAAEDLSDLEGDGFMSLDAVVESPMPPSSPLAMSPPQSPTSREVKDKAYKNSQLSRKSSEPDLDEGWEKAQQYWSGLTADKRRQLEQAAVQDDSSEYEAEPTPAPKPKAKPKKKVAVQVPGEEYEKLERPGHQPTHSRTYQITPGTKAGPHGMPSITTSMRAPQLAPEEEHHMRKSMRVGVGSVRVNQAPEEGHMRTTMRSGDSGSMRGSMRRSTRGSSETARPLESKTSLQKKYRPLSYQTPVVTPAPTEVKQHNRNISAGSSLPSQTMRPKMAPLRRSNSNDSDLSDSSFKRARPSSEGFAMRRSMRGSAASVTPGRPQSPEMTTSQNRSSRFSLRSLSPTGSAFRRDSKNAAPPASMPMTMRGNRPGAPSLRAPPTAAPPKKSSAFGRSKPALPPIRAPQRTSRFNDSSGDEDATPAFHSRFVDSSDEEDIPRPASRPMTTLRSAPVRAIPRQPNAVDGDSSDLPDTDEEKDEERLRKPVVKIVPETPTPAHGTALSSGSLRRSGSGRGALGLPTSTITNTITGGRPEHKRRGSFMSILRRKKDPTFKVRKSDAESAARRDTPLERSRSEVLAVKRQDSNFSTGSGGGGRKLEKRNTPKSMLGGDNAAAEVPDWPLPLPQQVLKDSKAEEERPSTADPNAVATRPDIGNRRATATGLSAVDLTSMAGTPKKKKKFGRLRRAFGLDD